MLNVFKKIASKLPIRFQQELKRLYFGHQINKGQFRTDEKEYNLLRNWVTEGDWVLDIGANVGHYTTKLSEIVDRSGRVIAFEPVPETFELLTANVARLLFRNVTLLNIGVSESSNLLGIDVPKFDTGLNNYYMAHLTENNSGLQVLCLSIDTLNLPKSIKLAKIDTEGHDLSVLKGMKALLRRDHPILIIEDDSEEVVRYLKDFDYSSEKIKGSHNGVFICS